MSGINVAVVGATGMVGTAMLACLEESQFPVDKIYALASERSAGETVMFRQQPVSVEVLSQFDFSKVQIALFSIGAEIALQYAPIAAAAGCVVIDNSSAFRQDPDVPLIVPEVNPQALKNYQKRMIIANPNCSTIQMLVALKPIYDAVGIERINVATYQSVSGTGKPAMLELTDQAKAWAAQQPLTHSVYPTTIAFNLIPHIDAFESNGYTKEEMKMINETRKIFEDDQILVNPTAVRVPVFVGHSEAVHIETKKKITAEAVRELLSKAPGVKVLDGKVAGQYPTPAYEGTGTDAVYVGRIREDISHPRGINMWVVADNIRKGAALNAVQIAQLLLKL